MLRMMENNKMIMARISISFTERELEILNITKGETFTNTTINIKHCGNLEWTRAGEGKAEKMAYAKKQKKRRI